MARNINLDELEEFDNDGLLEDIFLPDLKKKKKREKDRAMMSNKKEVN